MNNLTGYGSPDGKRSPFSIDVVILESSQMFPTFDTINGFFKEFNVVVTRSIIINNT